MPNVPKRTTSTGIDGDVDAADVTYTPGDVTDWDNDTDPGNVDGALDELADRADNSEALLNELLPPAAPSLNNVSRNIGTAGRLSFGPTDPTGPPGYTNHPTKDVGDLITTTYPEGGIISSFFSPRSGTLNDDVTADSSGAYPDNSFSPGDEGTLRLIINGTTEVSVDLSTAGSGVFDNGNITSFSLSAATPVQFPNGSDFNSRTYRTGTWVCNVSDLRDGYNTILIEHETGSGTSVVDTLVYIVDTNSTATNIQSTSWSNLITSGSKHLSGIEYHTDASATFSFSATGTYADTYVDGNAITYPNPINCSISSQAYPNPGANGYTASISNLGQSVSLNASRIITGLTSENGFSARVRLDRVVGTTVTSSYNDGFNLLIDTVSSDGTDLNNNFNDESRRIPSNANFDNDLSSTWDETISLVSATSGYSDGLQTINGGLYYPTLDFTAATDGPAGQPDYSSATGDRYYYGLFTDSVGSANFRLTLQGNTVQVISEASSFTTSQQIKISIKLPQGAGSGTGWLDITQAFVEGNFNDGDGAYAATFGSDQTINSTNWGLSVGTRNTANSYDKLYYRITAPSTFTGNLTRIGIEWAVT